MRQTTANCNEKNVQRTKHSPNDNKINLRLLISERYIA